MSTRMRAADTDRQQAADLLAQHVGSGRLSTDEYDQRVQKVYGATYLDEIDDVFTDLPGRSRFTASSGSGGFGTPFDAAFGGSWGSMDQRARPRAAAQWAPRSVPRSPLGAVLAFAVGIAALMVVGSIVVGVIAVALHLVVPLLVIALVVGLIRGRRGPWRNGPWRHGSWQRRSW